MENVPIAFSKFLYKFRSTIAYKILGWLSLIIIPLFIFAYSGMVGPTGFGAIGYAMLVVGIYTVGPSLFSIVTAIALLCAFGSPKTKPNIAADIGYVAFLITMIIALIYVSIYIPQQKQSDKFAQKAFEQDKIMIQKVIDEINTENERLGYPYFYENSTKYEFLEYFFKNINGIKRTEPNKFITDKKDYKFDCFLQETKDSSERVVDQCNIFITYKNGLLKTKRIESVSTNHFHKNGDKKHLIYKIIN